MKIPAGEDWEVCSDNKIGTLAISIMPNCHIRVGGGGGGVERTKRHIIHAYSTKHVAYEDRQHGKTGSTV